ncbi:hypothetical protein M2169_005259 [Streptomyces sp. MJP52]|nr:hypothetical protein [Streptomyces sp. MJP52]
MQPVTGSAEEVTAAMTCPSRSSAEVCASSSRRSSKQTGGSCGTRVRAGRNQVARESAFTAMGTRAGAAASASPSSAAASCSRAAS